MIFDPDPPEEDEEKDPYCEEVDPEDMMLDEDFDDDFDFDDNDSYGSIGWGTDEYYEYEG